MDELFKSFKVIKSSYLTQNMVSELSEILECVDIKIFRRYLRSLTLYYLNSERDNVNEDFRNFLEHLPTIFDFLDLVEDKLEKHNEV